MICDGNNLRKFVGVCEIPIDSLWVVECQSDIVRIDSF